ncbi:glutathione S-transferase N-terminal domain-containing protein [Aliamphritea spongicola]|nr:glutathione S-transferase N-terminal domain-containing protein [Aliamphritea spongicola]
MKIYGDAQSGNCYKALLTAALLELEYEWVAVDILQGQTHTPEFLKKNPNGKIPLLELDDGRYLSESNAILSYLTEGTALWREDRFARGRIMQWMFLNSTVMNPTLPLPGSLPVIWGCRRAAVQNMKPSRPAVTGHCR